VATTPVTNARQPYLSLVVATRNDDHGGNLLGRTQIFLDGWLTQAHRYNIPSELIFVEWNPPGDRPPLAKALRWPKDFGPCVVRFIEVPAEVHQRYQHAAGLPLYQMIGKNVGIRRARGRFVLATNIDILFSNELAAFLGAQRLDENRMYRVDRYDAMSDVPPGVSLDEQLDYCRKHLIRVNRRDGTFEVTADGGPALGSEDIASPESGILLGRGWLTPERSGPMETFRWAQKEAEVLLAERPEPQPTLVVDLEPGPGSLGKPLNLEVATNDGRVLARLTLDSASRSRLPLPTPMPNSLCFRAVGEFSAVNFNTRTLCFRAFRFHWEDGPDAAGGHSPPQSNGIFSLWRSLQYVIGKLAHGGPLVPLTVPVSPRMRRILKFYVEHGGISGIFLRRTRASAAQPEPTDSDPAVLQWPSADYLHTNASGDFQLASREHWCNLRGYPEFDMYSMNIDSVFCFVAQYGGAPEEFLADPMRIYHIEHGSGSGWTPDGQQKLYARLAAKGIPVLDNEDVLRWGAQMKRLKSPMIFNHEDWGLGELALRETVPAARSEERPVADAAGLLLKPRYHPAFDAISAYAGKPEPGFEIDFLGIKTRCEFLAGESISKMLHTIDPSEDTFEWIDLLESILAAKDEYTMMELGAGYGRWSVRAALALHQLRGLPFHLVAVEGEPRHYRWLEQHMVDNGIPCHSRTLIQGVVSNHRDDVLFYVGSPSGEGDEPASWYGQAIIPAHEAIDRSLTSAYEGQDVIRLKSGWKAVKARSYLLTDILPETDRIDLIDLDVQGEELRIIASAIEALNQRVARLRIGTHSHEIEMGLRELLSRHGWECKTDYPCAQTNETPWGPVEFVDGAQSWVNSKRFPEL
jgi:FkbM family methyltransferase